MMSTWVCVTGASGYIASVLVKELLVRGYNVKATVRTNQPEKVSHLKELSKDAKGTLELVEADLLKEGSFDKAVEGCTYVFHTASPFQLSVANPQRDLIEPAVNGTRNVLSSVVKFKNQVKRTILTSSLAAVRGLGDTPKDGKMFTEDDWNQTSTLESGPYMLSKKLAEKEAWQIAEKEGLDLVVINPGFVIGPPVSARVDGTSIQWMLAMLQGKTRGTRFNVVDVRDVVNAHIAAMERPEAKGRHLLAHQVPLNPGYAAQVLKDAFPQLKIDVAGNKKHDASSPTPTIDNSKVQRELGITLRPIETSLIEMAQALIDLKLINA